MGPAPALSKKRLAIESKKVTYDKLKPLMKRSREKCQYYQVVNNSKIEYMERKIIIHLKINELEKAKALMIGILSLENMNIVYKLLEEMLEYLSEKCYYLLSKTECPVECKGSLNSIIYSSNKLDSEKFNDLILFKEKISLIYGQAYISNAENNVDNLVNKELVARLNLFKFDEKDIEIRLKQICEKNNINFKLPEDSSTFVNFPKDIFPNQTQNLYEGKENQKDDNNSKNHQTKGNQSYIPSRVNIERNEINESKISISNARENKDQNQAITFNSDGNNKNNNNDIKDDKKAEKTMNIPDKDYNQNSSNNA